MTADDAVITKLKALSPVTALVGQRIYHTRLPQAPTLPAIAVQRIGVTEFMHLRGASALYRTRVQVTSVASESSGADPVASAQAIDAAVRGDGGTTGLIGFSGTIGSLDVKSIQPEAVVEAYDPQELKQYRVMRDVMVWHT